MKIDSTKRWLLAVLLLSVAVGCSRQKTVKTSLEGQWAGHEASPPNAECKATIAGNQLEFRGAQSNDWCRGVFVLDEKTQPRQMDLAIQESPQNVGVTALAIYEQQGNDLKIAVAPPGDPQRPVDFISGPSTRVVILKRE
ncbi:MAG TPA: TIGR03067 domain-containing protein [Verrucomicrobiae bacterium]|nr:TIGR03067 domain-containing protein [Verrucomicrobiae bacterium]